MSTSKSFNKLLKRFLHELLAAFPSDKNIQMYKATFDIARKATPGTPIKMWNDSVTQFKDKILAKDEEFILEDSKQILPGLDLYNLWGDASDNTKECIWNYLAELTNVASHVEPDDEAMHSMIQDAIKAVESKNQEQDPVGAGLNSIMPMLQGFMKEPDKAAPELENLMKMAQSFIGNIDEEKIMQMGSAMGFVDPNTKEIDQTKIMGLMGKLPSMLNQSK